MAARTASTRGGDTSKVRPATASSRGGNDKETTEGYPHVVDAPFVLYTVCTLWFLRLGVGLVDAPSVLYTACPFGRVKRSLYFLRDKGPFPAEEPVR